MGRRLGLAAKEPRAFHHELGTELAPWQFRRIALGDDADPVAVDDHRVPVDMNLAGKAAVRGIVSRQVGIGIRIAKIVDRDYLDFTGALALVERPQHIAPDAAVAIDTHFDRHGSSLQVDSQFASTASIALPTFAAVNPKYS